MHDARDEGEERRRPARRMLVRDGGCWSPQLERDLDVSGYWSLILLPRGHRAAGQALQTAARRGAMNARARTARVDLPRVRFQECGVAVEPFPLRPCPGDLVGVGDLLHYDWCCHGLIVPPSQAPRQVRRLWRNEKKGTTNTPSALIQGLPAPGGSRRRPPRECTLGSPPASRRRAPRGRRRE